MTCIEAEPFVSALFDGEPIPAEAANHINRCAVCRSTMTEYAQMGTELRMSAAMDARSLPPLHLPPRQRAFDFLWRRVPVPRFALAVLMVLVIGAAVSVPLVRAQPKPLWFQFGYTLDPSGEISHYQVVKSGFDETGATMMMVNGALRSTALRVNVESVSSDDVVLRCRAVPGDTAPTGQGQVLHAPGKVPWNNAGVVHYKPGERLAIPIEGGGTVYLKGAVYEQQPKIAFGYPLEPAPDQLVMRGAVFSSEGRVLWDLPGGGAVAHPGTGLAITAGHNGKLFFALTRFPGAVEGRIEWGKMTFTSDGHDYRLFAAAPLAGGEQPRPVWVRYDPTPALGESYGTEPLPQ